MTNNIFLNRQLLDDNEEIIIDIQNEEKIIPINDDKIKYTNVNFFNENKFIFILN